MAVSRNMSLVPNSLFKIPSGPAVAFLLTRKYSHRIGSARLSERVHTSLCRQQLGAILISASPPRFLSTGANGEADQYGVVSEIRADLQEVLDLLNEKKAENISILDSDVLTAMKALCRFMVILSCSSRRHMKVVADHVSEHFKLKGLLIEVARHRCVLPSFGRVHLFHAHLSFPGTRGECVCVRPSQFTRYFGRACRAD